jgi:hypothetical protein
MSPRCLRGSFFVARTALIRSPAIGRVPRGSSANFLHSRPVSPRGFRRRDQNGDQFRARAESPAPSGGALRDAGGARILRSLRPPAPWGLEHSWDLPIGRAEKRRSDVRVGIPTQQPTGWLAVEAGGLPAFWVLRIARRTLLGLSGRLTLANGNQLEAPLRRGRSSPFRSALAPGAPCSPASAGATPTAGSAPW